ASIGQRSETSIEACGQGHRFAIVVGSRTGMIPALVDGYRRGAAAPFEQHEAGNAARVGTDVTDVDSGGQLQRQPIESLIGAFVGRPGAVPIEDLLEGQPQLFVLCRGPIRVRVEAGQEARESRRPALAPEEGWAVTHGTNQRFADVNLTPDGRGRSCETRT